jgi:hypothetical protein
VLLFLRLGSRPMSIAGFIQHSHEGWTRQTARNATLEQWRILNPPLPAA